MYSNYEHNSVKTAVHAVLSIKSKSRTMQQDNFQDKHSCLKQDNAGYYGIHWQY